MTTDTDNAHIIEKTPATSLEDFAREHTSALDSALNQCARRHAAQAAAAIIGAITISTVTLILGAGSTDNIWWIVFFDLCLLFAATAYAARVLDDRNRAMRALRSDDVLDKCEAYVSESHDYDWNKVHPITEALKKNGITVIYRAIAVKNGNDRQTSRVTLECETFDDIMPIRFTTPYHVTVGERFASKSYDVIFDLCANALDIRPSSTINAITLDI